MIRSIFLNVIEISVFSSFFIVIMLLISKKLKSKYTNRLMYIVWLFMAIRLAIPFNISIPIINIPSNIEISEENTENFNSLDYVVYEYNTNSNVYPENSTVLENISNTETKEPINILSFIPYIWLLGVIICFSLYIFSHISFKRMIKRWREPISDANILDIYINLCNEMNITKRPKIFICKILPSPLCTGIFKNEIYINSQDLSGIKLILAHELTHCKRKDILYKLILIIGKSIHFFNPLVYIMTKQAEKDMELYCDETVIKNCSIDERKEYSITILNTVKSSLKNPVLTTGFSSDKETLKMRFSNILDTKVKKRGIILMIVLSLLGVSGGIFVSCKSKETNTETTQEQYIQNLYDLKTPYIGNASAVGSIYNSLEYSNVYQQETELFTTENEPYGVLKNFATEKIDSIDEKEFVKNSVVILTLIDNCDFVKSRIYAEDGAELTYTLTRDNAQLQFGNFKVNFDDKESYQKYIENTWERIDNDYYVIERENEKTSSVALIDEILEDKGDRVRAEYKYHPNYTQLLKMGETACWDFIDYFRGTTTDGDKEYIMMKICRENYPNTYNIGDIGETQYESGREWFNDYEEQLKRYSFGEPFHSFGVVDKAIQNIYEDKYKDLEGGYTVTNIYVIHLPEKIAENQEALYVAPIAGYFVMEDNTFKAIKLEKIPCRLTFDITDNKNPILIKYEEFSENNKNSIDEEVYKELENMFNYYEEDKSDAFEYEIRQFMKDNNIKATTVEFGNYIYK